jgi:long-subunit acyl-CoA synthetase (AMP-forming)
MTLTRSPEPEAITPPRKRRHRWPAVVAPRQRREGIRRWRVLPHDLTLADGEPTPMLKVKRHVVLERCGDLINEM